MLTSFIWKKKALQLNASRAELCVALKDKDSLIWVDMEDPTEFETEALIELFNFHPLAIEDCINDQSDPKFDDYEDYLFLVMHGINQQAKDQLATIELDIFVNKNFVVTFHKQPMQSVQRARELASRKIDPLIPDGTDMMLHAILDRLVDNYMPVVADRSRRLDELEESVFEETNKDFLPCALKLQKDVLHLRRMLAPQREILSQMTRSARTFVRPKNMIYFRDIEDHMFRYYQMTEELLGMLNGVIQIYFSHASTKLNEVIKALTVLATISLPPVAIASIYGMNFSHMPELHWKWGYLFSIGLMAFSSGAVLLFLKWKKWF